MEWNRRLLLDHLATTRWLMIEGKTWLSEQALDAFVSKAEKSYVPVAGHPPFFPNQYWMQTLLKVLESGTECKGVGTELFCIYVAFCLSHAILK